MNQQEPEAPINPAKESFWASKSMILLAQDALHDLIYVVIGAVSIISFHKDLTTLLLGMAGIRKTGTASGVARNVIVDGQARQAYNAAVMPPTPIQPASSPPAPSTSAMAPPPPPPPP